MKKVITFLLMIFTLLSTSVTCLAAGSRKVVECPVYAKYHSSNIELNTTIIKSGKGILTTQDGSSIAVFLDGKYDEYVLVVHLITEKEKDAFEWFKNCVPSEIVEFSAYDIYLLNSENDRVELPDNTLVQISVSNRKDFMLGLSCLGTTCVITTTYEDGKLKFNSSEESNYYLRCRNINDMIVDTDSPQTGDTMSLRFWLVCLFASAVVLIILILDTKKHCFSQNNLPCPHTWHHHK